ncbi:MAG: hypothetical protein KDJ70_17160 [Candidatus Competibacteraceae bacterium]|jgi:hypothetical protein|nr:hypothetical protein [Candidatus Competibacteraceae bacterium]
MTQEEIQQVIDTALKNYTGDARILESAIGSLFVGLQIGWRPLHLIHRHKTLSRYQNILDLDFREVMPEIGRMADKSLGWRLAKHLNNFWDAVRGTAPGRTNELG